jgi:hypothetical protein
MLEAMIEDELFQPNVIKFSKKSQHSQHFYVLHVGWIVVYKCAVDTTDPASREQVISRIPLRACTVAEHLPIGQKGGNQHSFQLNVINPDRYDPPHSSHRMLDSETTGVHCSSVRGEKCSKIIFHPASEAMREQWLDKLALACDSDESDDEYEAEEKAAPSNVARSAKEFDARQIIRMDGQEDSEREV